MAVKQSGGWITWEVNLRGSPHTIQFEHGTTTGRRVVRVDGKEISRQNWMFKLVGAEQFKFIAHGQEHVGNIHIEPDGFGYVYSLEVDGKPLEKFLENTRRATKTWHFPLDGVRHIVVLDRDNMEIFLDGEQVTSEGVFGDEGTETHFTIGSHGGYVLTGQSLTKKTKLDHRLFVDDMEVDEDAADRNLH